MFSFRDLLGTLRPAKLRGQLFLGIVLIQLALMTSFVLFLVNHQRKFLQQQNLQQTISLVHDYGVNSAPYVMANDFDELERLTISHINFPNLKYAMVLSSDGVVLAHTNTGYIGSRLVDSVSMGLNHATSSKILIENQHVLDIAVPIIVEKKMVAWARAGVGQDYIQTNMISIIRRGVLYILLALVLSTLSAVIIANQLTKGLYKLMSTADDIKEGDRNVRAPAFQTFELSELAKAFNQMLDDISKHETLLGLVIESMPVGVWVFNDRGVIISDNTAGRQIWEGAKKIGVKGSPSYKAWRTDTGALLARKDWASMRAITLGETTINEEIKIELPDGKHKILLNSAMPLKSRDNQIIGAIAINVDITERKKIIEQLELSESTLRSAFEDSAIGMAIVMPDGTFQRVNKELCRIVGYKEKELLSTTFQQITVPADLEEDIQYLRQTLNGEIDSYQMDKRYFHKNGSVVWVHLAVSLVRSGDGKPLFFVSQIEDIGERKRQEAVILHEKNLSDTMINYMPGIFYLIDRDGNLLRWNANLEVITGYSNSEIASMKSADLISRNQLELALRKRKEALEKQRATVELDILTKNGDKLHYYITVISINYNDKPCLLAMGVDFTEKKKVESDLRQKNREIEERVRELKCLYSVSELSHDKTLSLDKMMERCVPVISDAFSYPGATFTKITLGEKIFQTPGFADLPRKTETALFVKGQQMGELVVCVGHDDEGEQTEIQFPSEKISLISSVTGMISNAIEKRRGDAELKIMAEEFRAIIENTNEAILLVSPECKVLRFNKTAKDRLFTNLKKEICLGADFREFLYPGAKDRFLELFNRAVNGRAVDAESEMEDIRGNRLWLRSRMYPVRQKGEMIDGVAILAENITEKKIAEQTVIQFSRLFQFTSAINDMMLHAQDRQAIFSQACNIALSYGRFPMAWIGNFSPEGQLEIFASAGTDNGYLDHLRSGVSGEEFQKGTFANAIRQRKPIYTNDVSIENVAESWKQEVLSHGYRSLISLPIIVGTNTEAVWNLYRGEAFFFSDEEVKLLQEVTNNIAYAIEKLQLKELQAISEAELRESEEKFRKLVEETLAGVFILQDGRYVYVNPQFEKISGYSTTELLTTVGFEQLIHKDDLPDILNKYEARKDSDTQSDRHTFRGLTKDGSVVPIEMIVSPITYKGKRAIIGTIIDITAQVEEEKRIDRAVTNAQEMERQQISMELHDNVKQLVAASLLNVDFMKMLLKDDQTTGPVIDNIKTYMREAIEELRKISHQLSPSVDNAISLQEKIKTLVNTMNVSNRLTVNYHFETTDETLGPDIQLAIYRILQEQFTNILKHSNASLVDVTVQRNNGDIRLAIEDNGVGFDYMLTKNGIGLENIKRRVQVHNGSYFIQTAPGKGCKLEVNIPLN